MYKVIIAGSRNFNNYDLLERVCDNLIGESKYVEVVSGTARGADRLGERYALKRGFAIKKMPADWDRYGKSAGYRRNEKMAEYGDVLIAFWDKKSLGTKHMIDLAHSHGIGVTVINF